MDNTLQRVFDIVAGRRLNAPAGSYTAKLYAAGETEVLKKIGEEAVEVVVAAAKEDNARVVYELADLVYHSMVLLAMRDLTWRDVEEELARRMKP
jgi:phosphoribosyl-ATP pyrophosphohydrolase